MFDKFSIRQHGEHSFSASEIVLNPEKLLLMQKYALISDVSIQGNYKSLTQAMNLMATAGWRCVNMVAVSATLFMLMEKTNYPRK